MRRARKGVPWRVAVTVMRLRRWTDRGILLLCWQIADAGDRVPADPAALRAELRIDDRPVVVARAVEAMKAAGLARQEGGVLALVADPLAPPRTQDEPRSQRRGVPHRVARHVHRLPTWKLRALTLLCWHVAEADDTVPADPADLRALVGAPQLDAMAPLIEALCSGGFARRDGAALQLLESPVPPAPSLQGGRAPAGDPASGGPAAAPESAATEPEPARTPDATATQSARDLDATATQSARDLDATATQSARDLDATATEPPRNRDATATRQRSDSGAFGADAGPSREGAPARLCSDVLGSDLSPPTPPPGGAGARRLRAVRSRAIDPGPEPNPPDVPPRLVPLAALHESMRGHVHWHETLRHLLGWAAELEGPDRLGFPVDWPALVEQVEHHRRVNGVEVVDSLTGYLTSFVDAPAKAARFREGAARPGGPRLRHDPSRNYAGAAEAAPLVSLTGVAPGDWSAGGAR